MRALAAQGLRETSAVSQPLLLEISAEGASLKVGEIVTLQILQDALGSLMAELGGIRFLLPDPGVPLPEGSIRAKVAAVEPKIVLEVDPGSLEAPSSPPEFVPGQLLNALVVGVSENGGRFIEIAGRVYTTGPSDLEPGTQMSVRVVDLHPHVVLKVEDLLTAQEAAALNYIRSEISSSALPRLLSELFEAAATLDPAGLPPELRPALQALQDLALPLQPDQLGADQLRQWTERSGLHYESRLVQLLDDGDVAGAVAAARNDLKGALLHLLNGPPREAWPAGSGELLHLAGRTVKHLETQQVSNFLSQIHSQTLKLFVPLALQGDIQLAPLLIQFQREGSAGKQAPEEGMFRALFLLDLEALGKTRVDVQLRGGRIQAQFYLEEPGAAAFLRTRLEELGRDLEEQGFPAVSLTAGVAHPDAPVLREFEALETPLPAANVKLVDVQV